MSAVYLDGYLIDCVLTESHKLTASATKYPTESGSKLSDNIQNEPREVTIEGIVSDTPIGNVATVRSSTTAAAGTSLDFLPSDEALAKLESLYESREPVPIDSTLLRYENMALTSLEITVDQQTGHALNFTATFQQIKIVDNNRTLIRVDGLGNGNKNKKSGVPVVVVHNGPSKIVTRAGYDGAWNPTKGRYEYATSKGLPGGTAIPDTDLNAGLQNGGLGPDENTTYFDQESDEWRNSDGTSVTQSQLDAKRSTLTQGEVDSGARPSWWRDN